MGHRGKRFAKINSSVSMLSAYKILEMQYKGNILKFGVEQTAVGK